MSYFHYRSAVMQMIGPNKSLQSSDDGERLFYADRIRRSERPAIVVRTLMATKSGPAACRLPTICLVAIIMIRAPVNRLSTGGHRRTIRTVRPEAVHQSATTADARISVSTVTQAHGDDPMKSSDHVIIQSGAVKCDTTAAAAIGWSPTPSIDRPTLTRQKEEKMLTKAHGRHLNEATRVACYCANHGRSSAVRVDFRPPSGRFVSAKRSCS
jgi:hypothetical protein